MGAEDIEWEYIDFSGTGANASLLDYMQVSYGGYNGTNGTETSASGGASSSITHGVISYLGGDGIYVDDDGRYIFGDRTVRIWDIRGG